MNKNKRILLVDDDIDDQKLFCDALSQMQPPFQCSIAENGREGLIKAAVPPPYDIIFLDLNMPVMNGYECLSAMKANPQLKGIPIVVLSTSANEYEIDRCKALGAASYLTKPNSFDELFHELNEILINNSLQLDF